jgi:hypothetical protein
MIGFTLEVKKDFISHNFCSACTQPDPIPYEIGRKLK